jgi:hypothetical protein
MNTAVERMNHDLQGQRPAAKVAKLTRWWDPLEARLPSATVKPENAPKRAAPGADASALGREIDQRVYRLYGLTADEIKRVEDSATWTCRWLRPSTSQLNAVLQAPT